MTGEQESDLAIPSYLLDSGLNASDVAELLANMSRPQYMGAQASTTLVLLYMPVLLVGLLGNGSMLFIVARSRRLQSVTNLYLCNMAVSDLMVCIICVPMAVGQALHKVWIYGDAMCRITAFLQGVSVCASIFTIAILSLDRLLAIRHPITFKHLSGYRTAAKLIVLVWAVSLVVMAPLLAFMRVDKVPYPAGESPQYCIEAWPEDHHRPIYDLCQFVVVYILPGGMIGLNYGLIGKQLWTEDENLKRAESEIGRRLSQKIMAGRKRVAKMLIVLAVLFVICWLPYHVVNLYMDFNEEKNLVRFLEVLPFTIFVGHLNSALNPILYFYTSKTFRNYLKRAVYCKRDSTQQDTPVNLVVKYRAEDHRAQSRAFRNPLRSFLSGMTSTSPSPFSRSSNTSLRSTLNLDSAASMRRRDMRNHDIRKPDNRKSPEPGKASPPSPAKPMAEENVPLTSASGAPASRHRREMLESTLSIPTTIQEESSRGRPSFSNILPSPATVPALAVPEEEEDLHWSETSQCRATVDFELSDSAETTVYPLICIQIQQNEEDDEEQDEEEGESSIRAIELKTLKGRVKVESDEVYV